MLRRLTGVLALILVVLLIAACSSSEEAVSEESAVVPGDYQTLTIDEFADILENQSDEYTILNVHIPYAGEVEGTDGNVPFNDLEALTRALPDKDAPIVLYCRSGNMSEQASRQLVELGYTNLYDVPGGMVDWQASGRSLIETQ